ncbi:hypothetical protein EPN52_08280 [bacterium]|nr:MAG: hypothetical protein EPN52_08280 [bacterium]
MLLETFAAAQIALYVNAGVIEGRGPAQAQLGAGRQAQADAFTYDLRSGRLLLAGHVTITGAGDGATLHAAAVVCTPNGTLYALVTQPQPLRERLDARTLQALDSAAPADAFAFPNLTETPWMVATSAEVVPETLVTLRHATFLYPTRGATVPSYVYVFSSNAYYANNTLPYASFDQPWPYRGGAHALETLHLRYDQSAGASLGFDHRLVFGNRAYALLSAAPLTQSNRNASLTLYQRMSPSLYQTFSATGYRQGELLRTPRQAGAFFNYSLTAALRSSYLQLALNQSYDSLVADGVPNHPSGAQLAWYGYDRALGRSNFHYRLHGTLGYGHDAFGLGAQVDPATATNAWTKGAGLSLSSPVYTLPLHVQLSAYAERDLAWYSTGPGRGAIGDDLVLTAARRIARRVSAVASYQLVETSNPALLERTSALGLTYDGPAGTQFALSLQHADDVNVVRIPYQAALDLRLRISRYGILELQRSYYFNYGGQTWSPRFTISLLP